MEICRLNAGGELKITLDELDENLPLGPEQQFLLFRMLQEGMQNVVRHAAASTLQVKINKSGHHVLAELLDNGHGFNTKSKTTGVGIANMRQRALSLGGTVQWESGKSGTTITILVPLKLIPYAI